MNFPFQELKTVLSAAQLLTLNTVPVLLVPGRAGCVIEVNSFYLRYFHGTTQYNPNVNAGDYIAMSFGVATDSNNPTVQAIQATGFVDQSVDMSAWGIPGLFFGIVGGNSFPLSTYVGQGLSVLQYNINSPYPQGANWTQGNGTLAIFVKYTYVEV